MVVAKTHSLPVMTKGGSGIGGHGQFTEQLIPCPLRSGNSNIDVALDLFVAGWRQLFVHSSHSDQLTGRLGLACYFAPIICSSEPEQSDWQQCVSL